MLRDRLVFGVNHSGIQCKFLSEGELIYASTLELAQTTEASEKMLQNCYRCGGPHLTLQCWHKDTECHTARKRVIQHGLVRPRPISHPGPWPSQFTSTSGQDEGIKKSNCVGEVEQPVSDKEYDMTALRNDHSEPYQLDVHLNDPFYENWIGHRSSSVNHQHHCASWTQTIFLCSSSAAMQLTASSKPIRVKRSRC